MSLCAWCGSELDADKGGTAQVPSVGRCHSGTSKGGVKYSCNTDAQEDLARRAREAQKAQSPQALREGLTALEETVASLLQRFNDLEGRLDA